MKTINREKIERMVGRGTGGGGGGGISVDLAGYASQAWVEQQYISKEFFLRLFSIHGHNAEDTSVNPEDIIIEPNDTDEDTTVLDSIEAKAGLWTNSFVSALGLNPAGGGTGDILSEPLLSINSAGLGHPTRPNVGIVWDGTRWVYGETGGGSTGMNPLTVKVGTNTTVIEYKGETAKTLTFDAVANSGITVSGDTGGTITIGYTLPTASANTLGGVKVGNTLSISDGVLNLPTISNLVAGTYRSVTVDAYGRVTAGTNPTTLEGYGITDAKIANGVITLGTNTITPLTDAKIKSDYEWWGQKMNADGKVNGNITIQLTTVDTNTYADANPKLIFKNENGSQNISLTFTDYDVVANPASLTLNGNQGNELFIAPRMKADRLYLYKPNGSGDTNAVYLEYDSANGGVHLVGAGLYSDSYVSAIGLSDSGSSSVFNEDAMWTALGTNSTNKLIASAYLGNVTKMLTITSGNTTVVYDGTVARSITINDMAAKQLTASTIDGTAGSFFFYGDNLINNQFDWVGIQVDKSVGGTDRGQLVWDSGSISVRQKDGDSWTDWALVLTDKNYASQIASGTITNAMLAGGIENGKLKNSSVTVNGTSVSLGGSITTAKWGTARNINVASSDGTGASTAVSVDGSAAKTLLLPSTIKASLTGNADTATTASKLSTVSKTAWGQTYWTAGGVPTNISGNMTGVGTISASGDIGVTKSSGETNVFVSNNYGKIALQTDNNRGLWDYTKSQWLIATNGTNSWLNAGNVGIGTSSPSTKLHVKGRITAEYDSTAKGSFNATRDSYSAQFGITSSGFVVLTCGTTDSTSSVVRLSFSPKNAQDPYVLIPSNLKVGSNSGDDTSFTDSSFVQIGAIRLMYDQGSNAIKVVKYDGTSANFYAKGAISALGANASGGSGGAVDWQNVPSNIIPTSNATYNLGSDSKRWGAVYANSGNFTGSVNTNGSLSVTGTSSFNGKVTMNGNLSVYQRVGINQEVNNNYRLAVTGDISIMSGRLFIGEDGQISSTHKLYVKSGTTLLDGNVGIGGYNGNYKLYVSGPSRFNDNMQIGEGNTSNLSLDMRRNKIILGDIWLYGNSQNVSFDGSDTDGGVTVKGVNGCTITAGSDIRQKNIIKHIEKSVKDIALAPVFDFTWKNTKGTRVYMGTSAQYWQEIFPESVFSDEYGYLSLDYGAVALASAVITARKVVDHELRVKQLEERIAELENEIKELKAA